jgi:hypothetical protein
VLSDSDKALYARQILLSELGFEGQQRLAATAVGFTDAADLRARAVAADYLARAGFGASAGSNEIAVALPDAGEVSRVAGDAALDECAAWLIGAFAAVEAIKSASGAGTPGSLDAGFVLAREVV